VCVVALICIKQKCRTHLSSAWAVLFANPHWTAKRHNSFFRLASNWAVTSSDFSSVSTYLFQHSFLSSTNPIEHNSVTVLQIVAIWSTVLSGEYFPMKFLWHFLCKEWHTKLLSHVGVTYETGFELDDWIYCISYIHTLWDYRELQCYH
jgi:hypothetical protein